MVALIYYTLVIFEISSMFQAENFAYKMGYRNLVWTYNREFDIGWHTVTVYVDIWRTQC